MSGIVGQHAPIQYVARAITPVAASGGESATFIFFSQWANAAELLAQQQATLSGIVALQSVGPLGVFLARPNVRRIDTTHDPRMGACLMYEVPAAEASRRIHAEDPSLAARIPIQAAHHSGNLIGATHALLAIVTSTWGRFVPARGLIVSPNIMKEGEPPMSLLFCSQGAPLRWRGPLTPLPSV